MGSDAETKFILGGVLKQNNSQIQEEQPVFTSQRGSAWQCYIGRWLSIGKHAFSTCRPGKTNVSFKTIFGTGDNVDETYKHDKFG